MYIIEYYYKLNNTSAVIMRTLMGQTKHSTWNYYIISVCYSQSIAFLTRVLIV